MMLNAGATSIYNPPEWQRPADRGINGVTASATVDDHVVIQLSKQITEPLSILVWGAAANAVKADVPVNQNKFIGSYTFPAGSLQNTISADFGPAYAAALGTLAGLQGYYLVLWVFIIANGSLRYAAGITLQVTEVSWLNQAAYWPLNEAVGNRRSIVQPYTFKHTGTPGQVAGPIDNAVDLTFANQGLLYGDDTTKFSPDSHAWSFTGWIQSHDLGNDCLIYKGVDAGYLPKEWAWGIFAGFGHRLGLQIAVTGGTYNYNADTFGSPTVDTFYHLAIVYAEGGATIDIYVNGTLSDSWPGQPMVSPTLSPLQLSQQQIGGTIARGSFADVAYWARALSPAEVTALYNAGAGLRFPYT
jgi:hypothetical protein